MSLNLNQLKIFPISAAKAPMFLLLEADPSEEKVKSYLKKSHCFVGELDEKIVGVFVLQPINEQIIELLNIAVDPKYQGKGIGEKLLHQAIETAKKLKAERLELGTGTFGYQLAFYQKAGFRVDSIDKDFFLKNYTEPIFEKGIQHKDMLRLAMTLKEE